TDRMDIYLEEYRQIILIRQKWKYNWFNERNTTSWTLSEKRDFHNKVDSIIWKTWGGQYKIKAIGNSVFAQKYKNKVFTINFDIQWVIQNPHWNVNVRKITKNTYYRSNVRWNSREINLDTEDTKIRKEIKQIPVGHEFGHTIGYLYDEYHQDFTLNRGFKFDQKSIMNIGMELRDRHLEYMISELNTIYSNTRFQLI
ncbi:hypothetical protein, partial [Capnocytophaga catalasegens]